MRISDWSSDVCSSDLSPLDKRIEAGHFREDLFYALSSAQFTLPSLSERRGDVGPLARHLLARIGGLPGMGPIGVTDDALRLLAAYAWPDNVRQLQDVLFRAAVESKTDVLTSADFRAIEATLGGGVRSEEHTSELQSLMRISYAVFCSKKKKHNNT